MIQKEAMEKNLISMAHEIDKLQGEQMRTRGLCRGCLSVGYGASHEIGPETLFVQFLKSLILMELITDPFKPSKIPDPDAIYGTDLDTLLHQVIMKWKALESKSGFDQSGCSETIQWSIFGHRSKCAKNIVKLDEHT
ncbi:hypothetical protein Tco_1384277 [Tanacetum coccineum]